MVDRTTTFTVGTGTHCTGRPHRKDHCAGHMHGRIKRKHAIRGWVSGLPSEMSLWRRGPTSGHSIQRIGRMVSCMCLDACLHGSAGFENTVLAWGIYNPKDQRKCASAFYSFLHLVPLVMRFDSVCILLRYFSLLILPHLQFLHPLIRSSRSFHLFATLKPRINDPWTVFQLDRCQGKRWGWLWP